MPSIIDRMDTRRLDLNLLLTLETLLAEQNVTRAAERLHLSQPAVSAQLNRLRDLFGDPLLVPAQRGMVPTAKAVELLSPLRHALEGVRSTLAEHHRSFDPAHGRLIVSIACTDYLQRTVVQPLLIALRSSAPGVRLAVRHLNPQQLESQMAVGEVDVALMTPSDGPHTLRHSPLYEERYVLIARRGHPRVRRGLSAEDFAQLEHVVVSLQGGGFRTAVDEGLAALGHGRKVALSVPSFLPVPELVAQTDLVALVPDRLLLDGDRAALKVVSPPFPVAGFAVGMLWHERNHGHSGHRWVRERIAEVTRPR